MAEDALDVLAIAPHPDDAELICGGTLIRSADLGYRTGVLDMTRGEMGTRGSPEIRSTEAARAAEVMGLSVRANAGFPDAGIFNTPDTREHLAGWIRRLAPRVVILPYVTGRHPDHRMTADLAWDACFLAGLARFGEGSPHRPDKILYAMSFREDTVKPTFVVDISEQMERKLAAIACYESQFEDAKAAGEAFPTGQTLPDLIRTQNGHYGSLIRRAYGEPFLTQETMEVGDVVQLAVRSM